MSVSVKLASLAVVIGVCAGWQTPTWGQVQVNAGEILMEADLAAGEFLGEPFTLGPGTVINVNGGGEMGVVGTYGSPPDPQIPFDFAGSTLNISGGIFYSDPALIAYGQGPSFVSNVTLNVLAGGWIGDPLTSPLAGGFVVGNGSAVTVDGGTIGRAVLLLGDSTLDLVSGAILNFVAASDDAIAEFSGGSMTSVSAIDSSTVTISGAAMSGSFQVSGSDANLLMTSGTVGYGSRAALGATVTIAGGSMTGGFEAQTGSHVSITGGFVGEQFLVRDNSTAEISGGETGPLFEVRNTAVVTISGGSIGPNSTCKNSAVLHLTGGHIGADFVNAGVVNISGGSVADGFVAVGTTNLFVIEASVDGAPLDLEVGETVTITQRGGALLEATLEDGSFIDFVLNNAGVSPWTPGVDWFDIFAKVDVTRVAAPPVCAGDANGDNVVNFEDINHVLANWQDPFDFDDITAVIANWGLVCP